MTIATSSTTVPVQPLNLDERIPSHLSIFAQQKVTGTPIPGMTCFAEVEVEITVRFETSDFETTDGVGERKLNRTIPLGMLATDHVGYLSFDLSDVSKIQENLAAFIAGVPTAFDGSISVVHIWVYPMGKACLVVDALQIGKVSLEVVLVRLEIDKPDIEDDLRRVSLLSMQNPSLVDWRISPGSFAITPQALIGQDNCESLLPSNYAVQEFYFKQLVRFSGKAINQPPSEPQVRLGYVFEYKTAWYPLGHALGQVVYSLPLAPGESVNIAVIDWARKSEDTRTEDLSVKEQLLHNQQRDRSITEVVRASLDEWQRGSSIVGGVGASGGVNLGIASFGASGSVGGSSSSSSGTRELAGNTVQTISDGFVQASSSLRELHSTVVVQSSQQEKEVIETRTVTNHNHCYAMTVLYYEVLRHYRVVTALVRPQPVLLVQYGDKEFTREDILSHRRILEQFLLEERFRGGFDAAERLTYDYPPPFDTNVAEEVAVKRFFVIVTTSNPDNWTANDRVYFQILYSAKDPASKGLKRWKLQDFSFLSPSDTPDNIDKEITFFKFGDNTFAIDPPEADFKLSQLAQVGIYFVRDGDNKWRLGGLKVLAVLTSGAIKTVYDSKIDYYFLDDGDWWASISINPPASPVIPPEVIELEKRRSQDKASEVQLLKHVNDYKMYYHRALWLLEDPNERAIRFSNVRFDNNDTRNVLDYIENRPLEILGDYVAFPLNPKYLSELKARIEITEEEEDDLTTTPPYIERLASLPTRGIFAEAKLGHCNACEEIDNTRFWDWQQSPIPEKAPEIAPVQPVTPQPQQPNLQPSSLPNSVVNIVNPPAAPDPSGLAAALDVLRTPNIFRDMSGRQEVADLLKKLSDNSIQGAEAANKAKELQNKYGTDLAGIERDREANAYKFLSDALKASNDRKDTLIPPNQAHDQIKVSENEARKGTLTKEEHKENVQKSIDKMHGSEGRSPVTVTVNFKHQISGPLDGEFGIEFIGSVGDAFFTKTAGGVGAGTVKLKTGEQYTIQIKGKRTNLPISLDTIASIPSISDNPAFELDVSKHITNRDVPIETNLVATIPKGKKRINLTVVADEIAKDVRISVKVTGSGTLKANLETELGLKFAEIALGNIKTGVASEISIGSEVGVELPIEYKQLTGNVRAEKNDLEL
jgi:hypothetical protein